LLHSNEASTFQDQDLSLVNQDASTGSKKTITSLSLCDTKTVTKYHDLNNSNTTSEILESDNQIIEDLIQEMTYDQAENIVSSEINHLYSNNDKDIVLGSVQSLFDLFNKAIKLADGQIKDKTARSKIYKKMKPFLPNITDANLHKKTERAQKILKLFGKRGVGIDKINYITYSASTISRLKDIQIQHIINQVASKTVTKCHDQNNSEQKCDNHIIQDSLLKTQIMAPNKNCLYQYAIEHGINLKEFSIITEAEKNRWTMRCFHEDLKRDIHFYRSGIERKEDPRKYRKFLTDQERLVGEKLLHQGILKSGLSTAWLDDLMEK
ncbi:8783_t:CDS:2, partial [Cetraspora pellucida]